MRLTAVILSLLISSVLSAIPRKVIVDTDVGVDDGFALALLLTAERLGEVDIVAITTVSGNTDARNVSLNVLKVLDTAKRLDVPVYQGSEFAIEKTHPYDNFFGSDGFGDIDYPNPPNSSLIRPTHAVQAMIQYVQQFPGEITLICIGPLTNLALAERLNPNFSSNLAQLVVLGGSVRGIGNIRPGLEFNFFFDPMAAFITFTSPAHNNKPIVLVPWELVSIDASTTLSWRLNDLGKVAGPMMELLNKAEAHVLETYQDVWVAGDALAAALVIKPCLIVKKQLNYITIETHAEHLKGASIVDYSKVLNITANTDIVNSINLTAFQDMLIQYMEFP